MASYKSKRGARSKSRARKKERDDLKSLKAETSTAREAAIRADIDKSIQKGGTDIMPLINKRNARPGWEDQGIRKGREFQDLRKLTGHYGPGFNAGGPVGKAKGRDGIATSGLTRGPSRAY
tara:strand:- start:2932 stop:3294 length:363 start_codon:yes stop_codon:yes gene_type:complete